MWVNKSLGDLVPPRSTVMSRSTSRSGATPRNRWSFSVQLCLALCPSSVPPPACAFPYETKDSDVLLGVTLHELH